MHCTAIAPFNSSPTLLDVHFMFLSLFCILPSLFLSYRVIAYHILSCIKSRAIPINVRIEHILFSYTAVHVTVAE